MHRSLLCYRNKMLSHVTIFFCNDLIKRKQVIIFSLSLPSRL
nr:MAG TPA: hypothetical protein [Caudoviricetes sp.]